MDSDITQDREAKGKEVVPAVGERDVTVSDVTGT